MWFSSFFQHFTPICHINDKPGNKGGNIQEERQYKRKCCQLPIWASQINQCLINRVMLRNIEALCIVQLIKGICTVILLPAVIDRQTTDCCLQTLNFLCP